MKPRVVAGAATLVASAALVFSATTGVSGYAEGAPPGFSGGFGEQSCHACHFHEELNSDPGRVTLTGLPERFEPGRRYPLTIMLARPGMRLSGFQLTARFAGDGRQAGSFAPAAGEEERIGVDAQGGIEYVNQRRPGATAKGSADAALWQVIWTAPQADSAVAFHVAANAADGDETAEGDYVYTMAAESVPATD